MARTMGLDVGDSRIGVALSDPLGILASPLTIITRREVERDIGDILAIAREHEVGSIVIGLPVHLAGGEGVQAARVREFAAALSQRTDLPIRFQDERLSTVEAQRLLKEAGRTLRGARYDDAAAAVILQAYLDRG